MFENLSSREKKLLIVIGALVPIAIVFLCVYQMTSSFKANNEQLDALKLEILNEEEREIEGMHAARRQTYYSNTSLHPEINLAGNDYQTWLNNAMIDSGLSKNTTTPAASSEIRSGNQTIGKRHVFKVVASGTLPQFNDFLCKFYQLDALHRINSMHLTPQNKPGTKIRDGELRVRMDVEALSLKSGKSREGFEEFRTNVVNKEKDYQAILRRNIFGPANSEPIITVSDRPWTAGKSFSTSFNAKDANENDLLTFELFEKSIEEATIVKQSNRKVRFEMPDVGKGEYRFKIKVTDNGFPSKSSIEEFVVTVKEPKPREVVTRSKPDPEVDYIRLVKVTGISRDKKGKRQVWILLGHSGDRLRLAVGETFEVGKKEYEVVTIKADQATFAGDEKTFEANLGWSSNRSDSKYRGALIETNL